MSGLLDKLAPETRTIIYEYVLSFDIPMKHATKMQPFVKKLTGVEPTSRSQSAKPELRTITQSSRSVNTSILTVSKLIYVESIAVFYARNTIHFDAQMCTFESLTSPHATDLSLATHVIARIDDSTDSRVHMRVGKGLEVSTLTIPAIFPNLRTCNVYVSSDTDRNTLSTLIAVYHTIRGSDMFAKIRFDGVGSVSASFKWRPHVKFLLNRDGPLIAGQGPLSESLLHLSAYRKSLHPHSTSHRGQLFRLPQTYMHGQLSLYSTPTPRFSG